MQRSEGKSESRPSKIDYGDDQNEYDGAAFHYGYKEKSAAFLPSAALTIPTGGKGYSTCKSIVDLGFGRQCPHDHPDHGVLDVRGAFLSQKSGRLERRVE